jgi:hypothetical protein
MAKIKFKIHGKRFGRCAAEFKAFENFTLDKLK